MEVSDTLVLCELWKRLYVKFLKKTHSELKLRSLSGSRVTEWRILALLYVYVLYTFDFGTWITPTQWSSQLDHINHSPRYLRLISFFSAIYFTLQNYRGYNCDGLQPAAEVIFSFLVFSFFFFWSFKINKRIRIPAGVLSGIFFSFFFCPFFSRSKTLCSLNYSRETREGREISMFFL